MAEINTKQIVQKWKKELKLEVDKLKENGIFPKLTIIQDSQTQEECAMYKRNKHRVADELGIETENVIINTEDKSKEEIITLLKRELSEITNPVIVQMPFTNITSTDFTPVDSNLYISSGIGTNGNGVRIMCQPSINFFRLSSIK